VSAFTHMLTKAIDIEPTTLNNDGTITTGTKQTDVAAHVEYDVEIEDSTAGSESDTVDVVWTEAEIDTDDRLHLPDGSVLEVQGVQELDSLIGTTTIYRAKG